MRLAFTEGAANATDRGGETIDITGAYVREKVEGLSKNTDLSRFVL